MTIKTPFIPRTITRYEWGFIDHRNCLTVEVDIPVDVNLGGKNEQTTKLYLLNHFTKDRAAFENLSRFPLSVNVLVPKSTFQYTIPKINEFSNIAWASLYDNFEDAENHRIV